MTEDGIQEMKENILGEIRDIKTDIKEVRKHTEATLIQTTKTNGRVTALENIVWKGLAPVLTGVTVYVVVSLFKTVL